MATDLFIAHMNTIAKARPSLARHARPVLPANQSARGIGTQPGQKCEHATTSPLANLISEEYLAPYIKY